MYFSCKNSQTLPLVRISRPWGERDLPGNAGR